MITAKPSCQKRIVPLPRLRRLLRRGFLSLLDRVLSTDDARALLIDRLQGAFDSPPPLSADHLKSPFTESAEPFAELPAAPRADVVFITARFRSGSTLLWNLFRHVPGVTAYYEPLNERRWFDPSARGKAVDPTHRQVSEYWQEYEGLEILDRYYRERWICRDQYMGPTYRDHDLKRYLEVLIERAPGRPVLQFNRVDFRLPWLRSHFPAARIVHLYRHPRDQWLSSLFGSSVPRDASVADFAAHDHFYLREWAKDLKYHFPFLDERQIVHPYALFYYLWKLSYAFGRRFGDYSLAFEDLLADPKKELEQLFAFLGIVDFDEAKLRGLMEKQSPGKWRRYADDAWFLRHEAACDAVLAKFVKASTPDRRSGEVSGSNHPPSEALAWS